MDIITRGALNRIFQHLKEHHRGRNATTIFSYTAGTHTLFTYIIPWVPTAHAQYKRNSVSVPMVKTIMFFRAKCSEFAEDSFMLLSWWCSFKIVKENLPTTQFILMVQSITFLTHLIYHQTVRDLEKFPLT
jgi:hypothetical protein